MRFRTYNTLVLINLKRKLSPRRINDENIYYDGKGFFFFFVNVFILQLYICTSYKPP